MTVFTTVHKDFTFILGKSIFWGRWTYCFHWLPGLASGIGYWCPSLFISRSVSWRRVGTN